MQSVEKPQGVVEAPEANSSGLLLPPIMTGDALEELLKHRTIAVYERSLGEESDLLSRDTISLRQPLK